MYKFHRSEMELFREICLGYGTARDLSTSTGAPLPSVYRNLKLLETKDMIRRSGGKPERIEPSRSLHAMAIRRYVLHSGRPLDVLTDSKLPLLLSIHEIPKSNQRIARETCLSSETVRKYVRSLSNYGILSKRKHLIHLSRTDDETHRLLDDLSKGLPRTKLFEVYEKGIPLWTDGLHIIFSSEEDIDIPGIYPTATSAMIEKGLPILVREHRYWFPYCPRAPTNEQVALHNLLVDPRSTRAIAFSLIFLKKFGFDECDLKEEASHLGLMDRSTQMISYLGGEPVDDPLFPERKEFDRLGLMYGVSQA